MMGPIVCTSAATSAAEAAAATSDDLRPNTPTTPPPPLLIRPADIAELRAPNCHIARPEHVGRLLSAICAAGPAALQVVSDFDYTITKQYKPDGSRMPSSFCVLNMCPSLPPECLAASLRLVQRFRPIELDPLLDERTKTAAMCEWWRLSSDLHRGFRLPRSEIAAAARSFGECLRRGAAELFERLHALSVPVLVLSAGLGDSVDAILRATGCMHDNVQVLGNFLVYDDGDGEGEGDLLAGFDATRRIHAFNKNEHALDGSPAYRHVHGRRNVLVMGDSLGDADMSSGCAADGNVLKIGFLYEQVSGRGWGGVCWVL